MFCSPTTTGSFPLGGFTPHTPGWQPTKYTRAPKPAGGFALLPLEALLLPWLAHEQGLMTPLALRGYLACIEMRGRRCRVTPETSIAYTTEELRRLLGAAVRPRAAATVRQILCATGLIVWPADGGQLTLCPEGTALPWLETDRYAALRAAIHPTVQQVPLPRRLVTWLAQAGAPGLIATVLGVACSTLRYREHQVTAGGSLLPSWLAATFQVPRRTVAYWLQRLRVLHWLAPVATPPAHRRAYGPWVAVNLQWCPPGSARPAHTHLATGASPKRKNLATPRKNLASSSSPSPPEALEISSFPPIPGCPHGNPVPDTQPHKHHENLCGDGVGVQRKDPSEGDPATHYATLPPETQATLYHDAEARLRQQVPAAFLIRPVVLAEVSRLLETPRAHPRPTPPIPRKVHGLMSTPRRPAIPGAATPPSSPPPFPSWAYKGRCF